MKGKLHKTETGWVVVEDPFYDFTGMPCVGGTYPIHPDYVKVYLLDEDAEDGEVEFEIKYYWTEEMQQPIEVAKLVRSNTKQLLTEIIGEDSKDAPKEDSDYPTTTTDLIDGAIWSLPFDERIKCWDLIEKLVEEEKKSLYTEEQVRLAIRKSRVTNTENVMGNGLKLHAYTDDEIVELISEPKKD